MTVELPAHVYARIAEDVSRDVGVDVSADDVEFIICVADKITDYDGIKCSPLSTSERSRFYRFNTYTRSSVVAEAKQYQQ